MEEHLVEGHLYGNYYTSTDDIEIIEEWCEECGDHDRVIMTYEEGKLVPELGQMFSSIKMDIPIINRDILMGLTMSEVYQNIRYAYYEDMLFIDNLLESEVIEEKDKPYLIKRVLLSKKRQLNILDKLNDKKHEKKKYKLKK